MTTIEEPPDRTDPAKHAAAMLALIRKDITAGWVPAGVASYEQLLDYEDEYISTLGLVNWGPDDGQAFEDGTAYIAQVAGLVDDLLPLPAEPDLLDAQLAGWVAYIIRRIREDAREDLGPGPFAAQLGLDASRYATEVRHALPPHPAQPMTPAVYKQVVALVEERMPVCAPLDRADLNDLHQLADAALQHLGFFDPVSYPEFRPAVEALHAKLAAILGLGT